MNIRILSIATALLLSACTAQVSTQQDGGAICYPAGKTAKDLLREERGLTGNNHLAYEKSALACGNSKPADTKAPRGYKPFYISHYGRHGSRSDYKEESWVRLTKVLAPAHEAGILTEMGEKAYEAACEMSRLSEGMREMLTPVGVREHAGIAQRMYERFPQVFKDGKVVDAKSSTVQRCVMSMASFTTALAAKNPKLEFDILTGPKYMEYIARTKGYQTATKGALEMLGAYKKSMPRDTMAVLANVFNDAEAARKYIKDAYHFESDMLNAGGYCSCFGVEDAFNCCLPFEDCYAYWSHSNRFLYLQHCNSEEFGDRRMPLSRMLVEEIIEKADAAIAGNDRAADLRFGHDYPLLALAGYLDIEGVGGRYSFEVIDENWFGSAYICMASNLQLIFYRNRKGDVLVKCLWNEREMGINALDPVEGPYYKWPEVRNYWSTRYPAELYPEPDGSQEKAAPGMPGK